jgi:hypothetical protein
MAILGAKTDAETIAYSVVIAVIIGIAVYGNVAQVTCNVFQISSCFIQKSFSLSPWQMDWQETTNISDNGPLSPNNYAHIEIQFTHPTIQIRDTAEFVLKTEITKITRTGIQHQLYAPRLLLYAYPEDTQFPNPNYSTSSILRFDSQAYQYMPNGFDINKALNGAISFKFPIDKAGRWRVAAVLYEGDRVYDSSLGQIYPAGVAIDFMDSQTTSPFNVKVVLFTVVSAIIGFFFSIVGFTKKIAIKKHRHCIWVLLLLGFSLSLFIGGLI